MEQKPIDLETRYIQSVTDLAVTQTLRKLGLIKVWLTTNECRELYGVEFKRLVDSGLITANIQGNRKTYNREDIEAAIAAGLKQARILAPPPRI